MTDFIIKLEDMFKLAGHEDWEITYIPEMVGYLVSLDDDVIFMQSLRDWKASRDQRVKESED